MNWFMFAGVVFAAFGWLMAVGAGQKMAITVSDDADGVKFLTVIFSAFLIVCAIIFWVKAYQP